MADECHLILCQADHARAVFAASDDDLESIKNQLARRPTRREITQLIMLATLVTAAVVLLATMLAR